MSATPALRALADLAEKYRQLVALRRSLPAAGAASPPDRTTLAALSRRWPGALRELETAPTQLLDDRLAAIEAALAGGPLPDWAPLVHDFHVLLGVALALRRGEAPEAQLFDGAPVDATFAEAVKRPRAGRLQATVIDALATIHHRPAAALWAVLLPLSPRARPRDYR